MIDVVQIERPSSNFIILESLHTADTSASKYFYIVHTENKDIIKIGRGQESDVRITDDISVSRCHAILRRNASNEYLLEDFESKFGTLV